jgi:hypothetical protein
MMPWAYLLLVSIWACSTCRLPVDFVASQLDHGNPPGDLYQIILQLRTSSLKQGGTYTVHWHVDQGSLSQCFLLAYLQNEANHYHQEQS